MDEQAEEIMADYQDYLANPGAYSMQDFEDIFQDRDPFEFLQEGPTGRAPIVIILLSNYVDIVSTPC